MLNFSKKKRTGFGKVSKNKLVEKVQNIGKSDRPYYLKRNADVYKMKDGLNIIRIMPPSADDKDFGMLVYVHSYIGPEEGSYLCLSKNLQQDCPICDAMKLAQSSGDEELSKELYPRKRVIFQILDIGKNPQSNKMLLLDSPPTLADDITALVYNQRTGETIDITDSKTGREINFERIKKIGGFPDYRRVSLGGNYPIKLSKYEDQVKTAIDMFEVPEYDLLNKIVKYYKKKGGHDEKESIENNELEETNDSDESEIYKKKKKKKKKNRF